MDQMWLSSLKGILNFGYTVKCGCYKPRCENTVDKWKDKKVHGLVVPSWSGRDGNIYIVGNDKDVLWIMDSLKLIPAKWRR